MDDIEKSEGLHMLMKHLSLKMKLNSNDEVTILEQCCRRYTPRLQIEQLDNLMVRFSLNNSSNTISNRNRMHPITTPMKPNIDPSIEVNEGAWLKHSTSKEGIIQRLERSGLTVDWRQLGKEAGLRACYKVNVFSLCAIGIIRMASSTNQGVWSAVEEQDSNSKLWRKLETSAMRALYALGLDTGEVMISLHEEQLTTVHHVTPYPNLCQQKTAKTYLYAIEQHLDALQNESEQDRDIQMGMDPEFILYDQGRRKVIPASKFLNRVGVAGCDSVRIGGRLRFPLAELRPKPAEEPQQLMKHLMGSLRTAYGMIDDPSLAWQAGGMPQRGFCLGGHLHFSGIVLTKPLLEVLDNYLALFVAVLEDEDSLRRRPRYGFLGDFRRKDYGDSEYLRLEDEGIEYPSFEYRGFEYRALPSFLISPLVTKGVIAIAKLIIHHYPELRSRPLYDDKVFDAFYTGDQAVLRQVLPPLITEITDLPTYTKYEKYAAPFLQAVRLGHTWNGSADIRHSWKLQIIF